MSQGPIQTNGTVKIEWFREKLLFSRCVGRRNTDKSPDPGCGILRTVTLQFSKGKEKSQGRGKNLHLRHTARDKVRGKMEGLCPCVLCTILLYNLFPGVLKG